MVTIMTALYFHYLNHGDLVSVKGLMGAGVDPHDAGEPGEGKNRLVYELARQCRRPLFIMQGHEDLTPEDMACSVRFRDDDSRGMEYVASPLLYGDRLYFTQSLNGIVSSLNVNTGKPLLARTRLPEIGRLYASPVGAADRIYFVGRDGTTLVVKNSDQFEVLAVNRLDDPTDASPAVVGKQLFLRSKTALYCIESPQQK